MTRDDTAPRQSPRVLALWATPRSISTAFFRSFTQRDDTEGVFEPFGYAYYFGPDRRSRLFGDKEELRDYDASAAYAKIEAADSALVFVKDIAAHVVPYATDRFLESITHSFILRRPEECLASIYRGGVLDVTTADFGFESLHALWKTVGHRLGLPTVIVEATRLRREPEAMLRAYCDRVGVSFSPCMLAWAPGPVQNWQPSEASIQEPWHKAAEQSRAITPPQCSADLVVRTEEHAQMLERATAIYEEMAAFAL